MKFTSKTIAAITGLAFLGFASSANALTINTTTNQIEASGNGRVTVRFDSVSAADSSSLFDVSFGNRFLFNNKADAIGSTIDIGTFAAGQSILFRLDNLSARASFFTGLASDNFDNVIHAALIQNTDGSVIVGFEDLVGGGDNDFNDLIFTVVETPLPAAGLLLLSGLAGLGFAGRKKTKAA